MFQDILNRIFIFPNSDAFTVVTYAFNGIMNQFDEFFANLPFIVISFGALSTIIGFGVSVTRKLNNSGDGGILKRHKPKPQKTKKK